MFPSIKVKTSYVASRLSGAGKIKVVTPKGTKTVPFDHSLVGTQKHVAAIKGVFGEGATVEQASVKAVRGNLTYTWTVFGVEV